MNYARETDIVHTNQITLEKINETQSMNINMIEYVKEQLNWQTVSSVWPLTVEFINTFSDHLNWALMCYNINLPLATLETFFDKFDHGLLLTHYPHLPQSFIDRIDVDKFATQLSEFVNLDLQYIIDNRDKLDWVVLCENRQLPEWFILEYHQYMIWPAIYQFQTISESFLDTVYEKYPNYIDWEIILDNQRVSESFITKIGPSNLTLIDALWTNRKLSEKFIEEWANPTAVFCSQTRDQWRNIARYQTLSESFIKRHLDMLDLSIVCEHQNLTIAFINEYSDMIEFEWLSLNQNLTVDVVREFKDQLNWTLLSTFWDARFKHIDEFAAYIDWPALTERSIPEHILQKYIDKFAKLWEPIIGNQTLSDSFIRVNINAIGLDNIVIYCTHDIDQLLIDFQDQVDWRLAWEHQTLKPETILKVQHHITDGDWDMLGTYQKLPESFIVKNIAKPFNWQSICQNQVLSEQFLQRFFVKPIDPMIIQLIGIHQVLSETFICTNAILQDIPDIEKYQKQSISAQFATILANRARYRNRNAWPPRIDN